MAPSPPNKLDLLFVVDDSSSMAGEQESLRKQFPRLIETLSTGMRSPSDPQPFLAVEDLHVGVISSDLGLPGANQRDCRDDGADDAKLLSASRGPGCKSSYPAFLSYTHAAGNATQFAADLGCLTALGTAGCGFQQQLEAPLKALLPSSSDPFTFLSGTGRGDLPPNQGFLRNDPAQGQSLIVIVVVTDHEDCSVKTTEHLWPKDKLPPDSPYLRQDPGLRCYYNRQYNFDVQQRYTQGLRKLRPGREDLIVFAAITGVPVYLVDAQARTGVDDDATRGAFYDRILNDRAMQEVIDPASNPGSGTGLLTPSCSRVVAGQVEPSTAYPPRRIVELARTFGLNGIVQSICQDDFSGPIDAIVDTIAPRLRQDCLPRKLAPQPSGKLACDVVWQLPAAGASPSDAPKSCNDRPFLMPKGGGARAEGGVDCKVSQLAVAPGDRTSMTAPAGDGWYYDDFSAELSRNCDSTHLQRIAFSRAATPPPGVTVKLECAETTQKAPQQSANTASNQPNIGTICAGAGLAVPAGDSACLVLLRDGSSDRSMFCDRATDTCVRACSGDADCPPSWSCEKAPAALTETNGRAYCVNRGCSVGSSD